MDNPQPVPFADWRPDLALLDNEFASEVDNVFVGENSYLPFPGGKPLTLTPLPAGCVGLVSAQTSTGAWKIYAGTATKLYRLSAGAWVDATRSVGGNYAVAAGDLWRFQQSGTKLFATNIADTPQSIDVDAGTNFADVANAAGGGGPATAPKARHVAQVGPHLVLSGLQSNGRKIQWSGTEHNDYWTVGLNLSDEQEMPEGGQVQGVAGGEIGYVVQERAIRTMQYLPGDTTNIFTFSRVLIDRGCISKYGFTVISGVLYFPAEDGFFALAGQQLIPIGEGKINDWFLRNSDPARRDRILAFDFQHAHRIGWAFHGSSTSASYDKILIYDWALQRWAKAGIAGQIWASLASAQIDLETDDPADPQNDPKLDSASPSLDSYGYMGGRPIVGFVDANGILSTLTGPSLQATMETAERHLVPGMRAFVSEVYPLDDAASDAPGTVTIGWRERLQGVQNWDAPVEVEQTTGSAYAFSSGRVHRFRRTIPAASAWTHAQGVLVEAQQDGSVA